MPRRRWRRASFRRAAKIASGSTSWPISRAMSASLGGTRVSAMKAGSSLSLARIAPSAAIKPSSSRTVAPPRSAATFDVKSDIASDLHRLPAVERIGIVRGEETQILGLDRQRQFDRRRKAAVERRDRPLGDVGEDESLARLASARCTPRDSGRPSSVSGRSAPALPTRPIASGITIGSLLGWSGVGGIVCVTSSR